MADIAESTPERIGGGRAVAWAKSAFDRTAAFMGLLALSPFLLLVAAAIRLDSAGPVLFMQERYGRGAKTFRIYKFRTMTAEASRGPFRQAAAGDARITRLGHFLRDSSIDELPQLLNVVRGDMALVGPRPHPMALDDAFREEIPDYMRRYDVRPGITGLAQIGGHRGATPTVEAMAARVRLDLDYVARHSLGLDLLILLRTVLYVFKVRDGR